MGDISIPGLSKSPYTTAVEKLVALKRKHSVKIEDREKQAEKVQTVWIEIQRSALSLENGVKRIFGLDNVLNRKSAKISDSSVLTAEAGRQTPTGEYSFTVKRLASSEVFESRPLQDKEEVPKGVYGFRTGDAESPEKQETVLLDFPGGSLPDFIKAFQTSKMGSRARLSLKKTDGGDSVLTLAALRSGRRNRIEFTKEAVPWAENLGFLQKEKLPAERIPLPIPEHQLTDPDALFVKDGVMHLEQEANQILLLKSPVIIPEKDGTLELSLSVQPADSDEWARLSLLSPPPGRTEQGAVKNRASFLSLLNEKNEWSLEIPFDPDRGFQTVRLPLKIPGGSKIKAVRLQNTDPLYREVRLRMPVLIKPASQKQDYGPAPRQAGEDALIQFKGKDFEEPENTVTGLVPGLSLRLESPSETPVKITVETDTKTIKNELINFISRYNQLTAKLMITSSHSPEVISEIGYTDPKDVEAAKKELGLLSGDGTVMRIRNRLREIVAAPYPTSRGSDLMFLSQLGISNDANKDAGALTRTQLRGYLELNEKKLDTALEKSLPAVKELFSSDNDGDYVPDNGMAYRMNNFLENYTRSTGIFKAKLNQIDGNIKSIQKEKKKYDDYLVQYEKDLKAKYGRLEGTVQQLNKSSKTLSQYFSGRGQ